jgi:hypothetical protein
MKAVDADGNGQITYQGQPHLSHARAWLLLILYCQSFAHLSTRPKGSSYPYSKASITTATARYRNQSFAPRLVAQAWLSRTATWTTSSQKWTRIMMATLASKNGGKYPGSCLALVSSTSCRLAEHRYLAVGQSSIRLLCQLKML